eukprot:jgi/Mesvir1/1742/Mv21193-RA.1
MANVSELMADSEVHDERVTRSCDGGVDTQATAEQAGSKGFVVFGPGLRHIDLSGCLLITDKALAIVATLCPLVEWISVSKCPLVTERGLLFLASSLPRLVHLDASRCRGMTDRSLAAIASHCPRLQSLCLAYCTELTDAGLAALAAAWAQPAPADARAYGPPVHGATRGSQVSHLDLSGCAQVSADALDLLLPHVTRVACLRLACLPCMGDAQLATAAAAAGASLQEVDVSGCPLVTDAGVRALALLSGPDGLRSVAVAGCEVTDAGIAALAEECVHLVYVDARGCPQLLGWEAASALGRWGQGVGWGGGVAGCLRSLDVRGCPGWDPDVCAYLARLCPLLALVTGGGASLSAHPLVARGVVRSHPDMHLVHGSGRETCREGTVVGRSQSPPFVMSGRKRCHEEETAGSGSCTSDGPSSPRQRLMWRSADVCRRRDAGALPSDVALSPRQHSHEADEPCLLSMTPATSPPVSACGPHGRGGIPVFSSPCCPMCYGGGAHPGPWEVWSRPVEDVGPLVAGTHAVMRDVSQSAPNTALGVGARFSDSTLARAHLWGAVVR